MQQLGGTLDHTLPDTQMTASLDGTTPVGGISTWNADETVASSYPFLAYDAYSLSDFGAAPAWGDGTLNFSMMPAQTHWINQSLGFDFNHDILLDEEHVNYP